MTVAKNFGADGRKEAAARADRIRDGDDRCGDSQLPMHSGNRQAELREVDRLADDPPNMRAFTAALPNAAVAVARKRASFS